MNRLAAIRFRFECWKIETLFDCTLCLVLASFFFFFLKSSRLKNTMFRRNFILFNVCVYVITVFYHIDIVHATRCSRIPEGSSNKYRGTSPGNFRIRIMDDSNVYKPGRTYTGMCSVM